jgi:hypothetical protein
MSKLENRLIDKLASEREKINEDLSDVIREELVHMKAKKAKA